MNSPIVGWGLAVLAVAIGYIQWGWQGVALAVTVIVFWMLLQFSRVLRVMRQASNAPVGHVGSAVMLHARLRKGMRLLEILPITGSLGQKLGDDPERFAWTDESGARVTVELRSGRCTDWQLERPDDAQTQAPAPSAAPGSTAGASATPRRSSEA